MFMFPHITQKEYLYNHQLSKDKIFSFPITGFEVTEEITIGKTTFINKKELDFNRFQICKTDNPWFEDNFANIHTVAIVDINGLKDEWYKQCDNTSIALQILKQSIGAIYICRYGNYRIDDEKRIVISNIGVHEVDEGLNPFFSENNHFNGKNISDTLIVHSYRPFEKKIQEISNILLKYYNSDYEMDLKMLKCFELLYCLNNEIYSNERILKICAFLNFIFIENETYNIGSPEIVSRIVQLFNYYHVDVYGNIPSELCNITKLPKLQKYLRDIYEDIRNKFSHGKINIYKEFTVISAVPYFVYKIVFMELICLLVFNKSLQSIKTSADLNKKIQSINQSYITKNKGSK